MSYAPNPQLWAAYAAVVTLICLTPGPAVLFVVSQGVWRGPGAALKANAAINIINSIYLALSGLGMAALLSLSRAAFTTLKLVGAAYLAWLGIKAIRASFKPYDDTVGRGSGRPFVDGLIVQGSNPKVFLFVGAIVPQFLDNTRPLAPQFLALWLIGLVIEVAVLGGYGLLAGFARQRANLPAVRAWLERAGGGILIGVGLATALYRKS